MRATDPSAISVFFAEGKWQTAGKVVINLNPDEMLARFTNQYERLV